MKVRKAVIPAAGLGTRMLPATKAIPKEMLSLVNKPAIQYIVEEAVASGIEDILIITNRDKGSMEDHFDYYPALEESLKRGRKDVELEQIVHPADLANIHFIRQKETKGLGHAVGRAMAFAGNEPVAVLLGDDIMVADKPVTRQLIEAAEKYNASAVGVQHVSSDRISAYSSVKVEQLEAKVYRVTDTNEKPKPNEAYSNFAILGRYVLQPEIFDILSRTAPGYGGEIQLTDALNVLCKVSPMVAVDFDGRRYDTGNLAGFLEATIDFALENKEVGVWLKEFIKEKAKTL